MALALPQETLTKPLAPPHFKEIDRSGAVALLRLVTEQKYSGCNPNNDTPFLSSQEKKSDAELQADVVDFLKRRLQLGKGPVRGPDVFPSPRKRCSYRCFRLTGCGLLFHRVDCHSHGGLASPSSP